MELISKKAAYERLMFESTMWGNSFTADGFKKAAELILAMDCEFSERIRTIAEHYGLPTQREQLIEECSELILAAQKCKRYGTRETFDNFCGELADVYIMVQQMMHLISPEIIGEIIDKKLDRQIQRIEDESQ